MGEWQGGKGNVKAESYIENRIQVIELAYVERRWALQNSVGLRRAISMHREAQNKLKHLCTFNDFNVLHEMPVIIAKASSFDRLDLVYAWFVENMNRLV